MNKWKFKVITQIFSAYFDNTFIWVLETDKDNDIEFINKYLKSCEKIYKVTNDVKINDTTHILVCSAQFSTDLYCIDMLHSGYVGYINDYISDTIIEIKRNENEKKR